MKNKYFLMYYKYINFSFMKLILFKIFIFLFSSFYRFKINRIEKSITSKINKFVYKILMYF